VIFSDRLGEFQDVKLKSTSTIVSSTVLIGSHFFLIIGKYVQTTGKKACVYEETCGSKKASFGRTRQTLNSQVGFEALTA
jgi:hypothetical protein